MVEKGAAGTVLVPPTHSKQIGIETHHVICFLALNFSFCWKEGCAGTSLKWAASQHSSVQFGMVSRSQKSHSRDCRAAGFLGVAASSTTFE